MKCLNKQYIKKIIIVFSFFIIAGVTALMFLVFIERAWAGTGVPKILNHQGRLSDADDNPLGGDGTDFCFKFSFYDDAVVGALDNKLWPVGAPSIMTASVKNGVYELGIGDTEAGGDLLDFDFQSNDHIFLNVDVAVKAGASCFPDDGVEVFENLSPRQRVDSSAFAINSDTVDGFHASQSAVDNQIPALTSGNFILGASSPQINAAFSNVLSIQGNAASGNLLLNSLSGLVGIGTANPQAKLHIAGNDGLLNLEGVDHAYIQWYPHGLSAGRQAYTGFPGASSTVFVIANEIPGGAIILNPTANGNVGIGTAAPSSKLEIVGGYATSSLSLGGFGLHFASGGATPDSSQIWWGDNTGWKLNFGTKDADNNFQPRVTFVDSGNVGIGTTTPSQTFSVEGNGYISGQFKSDSLQVDTNVQIKNFLNVGGGINVSGASSFTSLYDSTSTLIIQNANGSEILFAADTANNRVKIGDSGPAGDLTTLFIVDNKDNAGDPVGLNGAMYYSSGANKFRCFENGEWKDCDVSFRGFSLLRDAVGVTMTNAPAGGAEITNFVSRRKINLTGANNVRAQFAHSINSSLVKLRIDFSLDDCATWNATPLVAAFGSAAGANNNQTSAYSPVPLAAKADVCVRAVVTGNGALDPVVRHADIDVN